MDLNIFAVAAVAIFITRTEPLFKVRLPVFLSYSVYTALNTLLPIHTHTNAVHLRGRGGHGAERVLPPAPGAPHADAALQGLATHVNRVHIVLFIVCDGVLLRCMWGCLTLYECFLLPG